MDSDVAIRSKLLSISSPVSSDKRTFFGSAKIFLKKKLLLYYYSTNIYIHTYIQYIHTHTYIQHSYLHANKTYIHTLWSHWYTYKHTYINLRAHTYIHILKLLTRLAQRRSTSGTTMKKNNV